jgi:quercetin dioxygenase-like cupin family protein
MEIKRNGSQPINDGPTDWFTGAVHVQMLFAAEAPGRVTGGRVTFEPGARTAWHSHPFGQTLVVTEGTGRAQRWGGSVESIGAGDVVWFPAGEKHWHGAAPAMHMTHLAIQEHDNGATADWMETVTDEQYEAGSSSSGSAGL